MARMPLAAQDLACAVAELFDVFGERPLTTCRLSRPGCASLRHRTRRADAGSGGAGIGVWRVGVGRRRDLSVC